MIVAIVLLNAAVGFIQDFRAERAMAALRRLADPVAIVVRGGRRRTIAAPEIVRGDIVLLEAGDVVPVDLRLIEAPQLKVAEAALTGEAVPVEKRTELSSDAALPLADQTNMAFKGTVVTYGRARGIAVATGMMTELGKIASMLEAAPAIKTPLQRRLATFGRQLALAVLVICAFIFAVGLWRGEPALLMLLTALSLAVAAIPEALPAVVTVMLALGARNMARRNALVRRLPAVETLGSVSCICTDKTGTLTLNEMRAAEVYVSGKRLPLSALDPASESVRRLFEAMALSNDAGRGERDEIIGDPTEVGLWRAAAEAGFDKNKLERATPRRMELPFDSDRKRMTTFHQDGTGFIAYTKGAAGRRYSIGVSGSPSMSAGWQPTRSGRSQLSRPWRARAFACSPSLAAVGTNCPSTTTLEKSSRISRCLASSVYWTRRVPRQSRRSRHANAPELRW